jgi:fructose-bisphosphate aldolase, class I
MRTSEVVRKILANYESDNPGTKSNLSRILMSGKLAGTGKMVILPVDQGFEHGPDRSFALNEAAYDPLYHFEIAIEAGLNAYAAPLGMLEAGASTYAGQIPLILKVNSANSLINQNIIPDQAITSSVKDALRLGCSAIGFTIYPGSANSYNMTEEIKEMAIEAKSSGLAVVIWSYARGDAISKEGETAIDVISYSAHIAALLGAHIIKVKLPTSYIEQPATKSIFAEQLINISKLEDRVRHVTKACFKGRRLVVFSGGPEKDVESIYEEARAIKQGGGDGSIIGRNTFQRPKAEALKMLNTLIEIYKA